MGEVRDTTAYGSSWSGSSKAATQGVVYNKMQTINREPEPKLIPDYSGFTAGGWTKAGNNLSMTSGTVGYANRATYPLDTFEDAFNLSTDIEILTGDGSGYFEVVFGKTIEISGTTAGIGKDVTGSFIKVYKVDDAPAGPALVETTYITDFDFIIGETYNVRIEKRTTSAYILDIIVTNKQGKTSTVQFSEVGFVGTVGGYGFSWGRIAYWTLLGTAKVSNLQWGYPIDYKNVRTWIAGHSFIEGNSIGTEKDKRFAALMAKEIGQDKTFITGHGGDIVQGVIDYLPTIAQWVNNVRYLFLFIGTNDTDNSTTTGKMDTLNALAISLGFQPIWATIPPRTTGITHPICNAHIVANFNYVDVRGVFYEDDGTTIDGDMFKVEDSIHPSIIGHQRLFDIIKAKCQFLFSKNQIKIEEERIVGKAVTNTALTGSVTLGLDDFSAYKGTLTGNTDITFTDLPVDGESKNKSMEISGNFTLTFNDADYTVGIYSGSSTLNLIYIQADNFAGTLSIKISYVNIA